MESDKLLILIHGSGVVRAGQWARRYVYICGEGKVGVCLWGGEGKVGVCM